MAARTRSCLMDSWEGYPLLLRESWARFLNPDVDRCLGVVSPLILHLQGRYSRGHGT